MIHKVGQIMLYVNKSKMRQSIFGRKKVGFHVVA
ncbi:glyoxalase/bleomycin resistance/extradiol dioxygenase family protein, partial [Bacillus cereus]